MDDITLYFTVYSIMIFTMFELYGHTLVLNFNAPDLHTWLCKRQRCYYQPTPDIPTDDTLNRIDLLCYLLHSLTEVVSSPHLLWPPCVADVDIIFCSCGYFLLMAALWNTTGHYIFDLFFLLSSSFSFFLSSSNLSGRRLDVYHTSTHDVALVRI